MKRKFLEDLGLEKEVIDKILDENSADIGKAKGEVDSITSERDKLKTDIADRDKQLEDLKKVDVDALQAEIEKLQADNKAKDDAHAAEIKQLKIDAAVSTALTTAKARNEKAVKALLELDPEKIELLDDGTIKGLDDQIKKLTESDDTKFLFDTSTKKTQIKGAKPGETGKEDPDTKVDVSKMTYEELAAYMEANPDAEI
ncbi:phage scaffolding protein [Tepidibacter hydrothermalis]|uniref:Phage scaffolding protein n=1 Tax=Tepidibacter hydrothermalis TaxID=3036126 RepID=A0ABY8EGZ7_9FIRM|nr:phage scaffolding protein [Tepidibacter hydrothermalis]WFD12216.1 phage scaffolding protein [Tepidibacter hydrothermalis]